MDHTSGHGEFLPCADVLARIRFGYVALSVAGARAFAGTAAAGPVAAVRAPGASLPGDLVTDTARTVDRRCDSSPVLARRASIGCTRSTASSWIAIRAANSWCAPRWSPSTSPRPALKRALAEEFLVKRTQELADLGVKITVLQTPEGWTATPRTEAAAQARSRGHLRLQPRVLRKRRRGPAPRRARCRRREPRPATCRACASGSSTAAWTRSHEAFASSVRAPFRLRRRSSCRAHMARPSPPSLVHARRGAARELFAADVYCGKPTGGAVDAVAAAFGWLARERVAVINMSLVGPRNALLERVVASLRRHVDISSWRRWATTARPRRRCIPPRIPAWSASPRSIRNTSRAGRSLPRQAGRLRRARLGHAGRRPGDRIIRRRCAARRSPRRSSPDCWPRDLPRPTLRNAIGRSSRWTAGREDLGTSGRDDVYGVGRARGSGQPPGRRSQ